MTAKHTLEIRKVRVSYDEGAYLTRSGRVTGNRAAAQCYYQIIDPNGKAWDGSSPVAVSSGYRKIADARAERGRIEAIRAAK